MFGLNPFHYKCQILVSLKNHTARLSKKPEQLYTYNIIVIPEISNNSSLSIVKNFHSYWHSTGPILRLNTFSLPLLCFSFYILDFYELHSNRFNKMDANNHVASCCWLQFGSF